jgi:hypothetical protein
MEMPVASILSTNLPIVEREGRPQAIAACRTGILPISIQSVYSFQIIVPVVQRIERRFPKAKTALLHEFAQVISSAQTAVSKGVE